jgi:hypothetical protein
LDQCHPAAVAVADPQALQASDIVDCDVFELAEETGRVAESVDAPIIRERLHEIAVEIRQRACAAGL